MLWNINTKVNIVKLIQYECMGEAEKKTATQTLEVHQFLKYSCTLYTLLYLVAALIFHKMLTNFSEIFRRHIMQFSFLFKFNVFH